MMPPQYFPPESVLVDNPMAHITTPSLTTTSFDQTLPKSAVRANGLSDVYFFNSNVMVFGPFSGDARGGGSQEATEHDLSKLEQIVQLNDDVYEIVPVDPLAGCTSSTTSFRQQGNSPTTAYASYATDGHRVNEGLAVLEILYNHPIDPPEYIDINDLASIRIHDDGDHSNAPDPLSGKAKERREEDEDDEDDEDDDDDDDVIFVAEYNKADGPSTSKNASLTQQQPRRNPVRKARKNARDLTRDLLYDEDYALLGSSSEEDTVSSTTKKPLKVNSVKELKKWPVSGLHERPEYNDSTKQLEKFDYTIRQIEKSVVSKKPATKITRKPTKPKKYYARRRAAVKVEVQEKVPVSELKELVLGTLQDVRRFVGNVRTGREIIEKNKAKKCKRHKEGKDADVGKENVDTNIMEGYGSCDGGREKDSTSEEEHSGDIFAESLELLKRQALLFQVINGANEKGVLKCFKTV